MTSSIDARLSADNLATYSSADDPQKRFVVDTVKEEGNTRTYINYRELNVKERFLRVFGCGNAGMKNVVDFAMHNNVFDRIEDSAAKKEIFTAIFQYNQTHRFGKVDEQALLSKLLEKNETPVQAITKAVNSSQYSLAKALIISCKATLHQDEIDDVTKALDQKIRKISDSISSLNVVDPWRQQEASHLIQSYKGNRELYLELKEHLRPASMAST